MKRHATAIWQGSGKEGTGTLSTQSRILDKASYAFNSRFENGKGTNPEELIAAAHAGCFTMQLAFNVGKAGFTPTELNTKCEITIEDFKITTSHLILQATIDGISQEKFDEVVADAKQNCPVSRLLNTDISIEATLNGGS